MYKTISNKIIRQFAPCYSPSEIIKDEDEELSVINWVNKYRGLVKSEKDILWLLLRNEFLSNKDLRLFAVWCARETFKLVGNPDKRSINAVNVAEKFANGEATEEELESAYSTSWPAVWSAIERSTCPTVFSAAELAAESASSAAAHSAYSAAIWSSSKGSTTSVQVDKLLTYFK